RGAGRGRRKPRPRDGSLQAGGGELPPSFGRLPRLQRRVGGRRKRRCKTLLIGRAAQEPFVPDAQTDVATTGVPGLDEVLRGGLPRKRIYLLRGAPGTGKTTLGLQFLLEGVRNNEPGLY